MRHTWYDPEGRPRFSYYDSADDLPARVVGTPAVKTIPADYGELAGKLVIITNPMNQAPWRIVAPISPNTIHGDFMTIFGPPPVSEDFRDESNPSLAFRVARIQYQQDQAHFIKSGFPSWATPKDITQSNLVFEYWGMSEPLYYRGRYGYMAKWDSFEVSAGHALQFSHHVVAQFQIRIIRNGGTVENRHPFVPPALKARKIQAVELGVVG